MEPKEMKGVSFLQEVFKDFRRLILFWSIPVTILTLGLLTLALLEFFNIGQNIPQNLQRSKVLNPDPTVENVEMLHSIKVISNAPELEDRPEVPITGFDVSVLIDGQEFNGVSKIEILAEPGAKPVKVNLSFYVNEIKFEGKVQPNFELLELNRRVPKVLTENQAKQLVEILNAEE
jgi:hypothetical protein